MKGVCIVKIYKKINKSIALTIGTASIVVMALTMAYFTSSDAVTNRMTAVHGSVIIQEPLWDSTGQFMAQKSEPGMEIPKNPSGLNDGQIDLYVRLKMTIELGKYSGNLSGNDTADGYVGIPTNAKRLKAIVEAIKNENNEQFLTLDTTGTVSKWKITSCNNSKFIAEETNYGGDSALIFYFYYTNGSENMCIVKPEESTAELFHHLDIPIYKKDYLGVFDQQYRITLQAEGIPVREDEPLTAADASAKFAEEMN